MVTPSLEFVEFSQMSQSLSLLAYSRWSRKRMQVRNKFAARKSVEFAPGAKMKMLYADPTPTSGRRWSAWGSCAAQNHEIEECFVLEGSINIGARIAGRATISSPRLDLIAGYSGCPR